MGCEFNFEKLRATNATDAAAEGQRLIDQAAYEYGHGGYTGSWAECAGVDVRREIVDPAEVKTWLDYHAEKWGPMLIVQAGDNFYAGANCSS
jgi:hypothetical protein